MSRVTSQMLVWTPRVLGVLTALFLGLFALDAFTSGRSLVDALPDFAIHLAPAILVLVVVVVSWRRPVIGGLAFIALGLGYVFIARGHLSWILAVACPLLLVGALFLLSSESRATGRAS